MTIRDALRRKKLIYFFLTMLALLLGVLAVQGAFFTRATWLLYPGIFLWLGAACGVLAYRFAVRCPRCRGNIGFSHSNFGQRKAFGKPLMNCPFCGVALDTSYTP